MNKEIPVKTPDGDGVIESVTISELKKLMVKIRYEDRWVNYSIGEVEPLLEKKDIKLKKVDL
jgi:hypothetical protein